MSGDYTTNIADQINLILIRAGEYEDLKKFKQKYEVHDEEGNSIGWNWSQYYDKYRAEKQRVDRIAPSSSWKVWEDMSNLYVMYFRYEDEFETFKKEHGILSLMGLTESYRELTSLLEGKKLNESYYFFNPIHYKTAFKIFYLHLLLVHTNSTEIMEKDVTEKDGFDDEAKESIILKRENNIIARWTDRDKGILEVFNKNMPIKIKDTKYNELKQMIIDSSLESDHFVIRADIVKKMMAKSPNAENMGTGEEKDNLRREIGNEFDRFIEQITQETEGKIAFKKQKSGVYFAEIKE